MKSMSEIFDFIVNHLFIFGLYDLQSFTFPNDFCFNTKKKKKAEQVTSLKH